MAVRTYIEAIREGMRDEMRRDPRVIVLGEDVGVKGGVFKATDGLHAEFGEMRVIDTPLAEEKAKDCVLRFRRVLEERGVLSPGDAEEVRAECMREVDRAQEDAESAPLPSPDTLHLHVYGEQ